MDKKDNRSKMAVMCFVIVCAIILAYLALLNGRYVNVDAGYYKVFDKWKKEYISVKNYKNAE